MNSDIFMEHRTKHLFLATWAGRLNAIVQIRNTPEELKKVWTNHITVEYFGGKAGDYMAFANTFKAYSNDHLSSMAKAYELAYTGLVDALISPADWHEQNDGH